MGVAGVVAPVAATCTGPGSVTFAVIKDACAAVTVAMVPRIASIPGRAHQRPFNGDLSG